MKIICRYAVLLLAAVFIAAGLAASAQMPLQRGRNRVQDERLRRGGGSRMQSERRAGQRDRQGQSSDRGGPPPGFYTDVPEHPFDIILGRPTGDSVTVSVLAYEQMEGYIEYGEQASGYDNKTAIRQFRKGEPSIMVFDGLKANTRYYYRLSRRTPGSTAFKQSEQYTFHTQRAAGDPFVFTVTADSHLDYNTSIERYARTLANASADRPDFHVDLGDTFMTGKYGRDYLAAEKQYLAQRYYFGLLCHSAPLFLTLGNHDGESGSARDGAVSLWALSARKKYFPNPYPDSFYSGNRTNIEGAGLLENYYCWEWGDALFVVLDLYWPTTIRAREGQDLWNRTLGEKQYRWLKGVLEDSSAGFKFIFIHHLVGGLDRSGRGGSEAASLFEWGGRDLNGSEAFGRRRPGWSEPIHQLLVRNGVSIVFHGHDHFYARQDLDGVVYQLVSQPGHRSSQDRVRSAAEYGYRDGIFLGNSGHLRVMVSPTRATIEYVRSYLPGEESSERKNGLVAHSYTIEAGRESVGLAETE